MKGKFYALRRPFSSFRKFIPHSLLLVLIFSFTQVSAKTVILGSGGGTVTQTNMNGLVPGDVLAINPGTYSGANFGNLNGITITNNGGTVTFTGTVHLNTLVGCTISNFNFLNVSGIAFRWDGNSRRCLEQNCTFTNVSGGVNDAADQNPYNGDTSSLKLYMVTMDNLKLFKTGILFQGSYGGASSMTCYIDRLTLSNITIDSTLTNGTEVTGVLFNCNFHDWKVNYKGTITVAGDVGLIQMNGNGSFYNIYRNGGRGYIMRIWNVGLKTVANTYFYNNIDLNTVVYGTIDTRIDATQFTQYTTGSNCYVWNNTSGNKGDNINYWSSLAVIGNYPAPYIIEVKNNLGFNLSTRDKPKICMDQGGNWDRDSSNNLYFNSSVGVVDPVTGMPYAGSPVLGKGATLPMVTTDIYGTPRTGAYDIGAVQHTGAIIPPPPNQPPVANAGAKQTITLPTNTVPLDGTKSKDPDGTITAFAWTQSSGPTTSTITNGNTVSAIASGLNTGTYIFKLVVTDNNGATGTAYDTVIVNPSGNLPPIANAGADVTITLPTNSVNLNGSASSDPDGTIASYSWAQSAGPSTATIANATTATTTATNLIQGTYVFKLTVTDNGGAKATDSIIVKVNPPANQPPIANAGADVTINLPTSTVNLNGSASTDPDGTIASYSWVQSAGPSTATIANATAATTTASNLIQGTYVFKLTVTDNKGATGTDSIIVKVNAAANQPPVANAGADLTITLPTSNVNLDGTASSDPDGTIAGYSWTQSSGPSTATIGNATSATTTASALIQGTYVFKLTVTDNKGATATDSIIVKVKAAANQPPQANAGNDQTITLPVNTGNLNGSGSADPDGTIASYSWTQSSGPSSASITNATAVTTTATGLIQGTYVFRLTVTDNAGATGTDSVIVHVNAAANQPPVSNPGTSQTITLPVNTANLDGTGSSDPDGTISTYNWTQVSGPSTATLTNGNTATATAANLVAGQYIFQLAVTDNSGATSNAQVKVTVINAGLQPPVANAGADQTITLPTNNVNVNGGASQAPSGTITGYSWTQSSGPNSAAIGNANSASTAITGLVQGTYIFKLTVTDNNGETGTDSITIKVNAAVNQPPVANAGTSKTIQLPTNSTNLDGTSSADPDGSIASYNWTQVSGPSTANLTNASASTASAGNLVVGQYIFQLTVTDNSGATGTAQVKINVIAAANEPPVANAGASRSIQLPLNSVNLDGTASSDPDGSIVSYSWTQISGPSTAVFTNANTATATASNLVVGQYVFELTVTDNLGATGKAQVKINEIAAANQPPIANAGASKSITLPVNFVTLDGTASSDPDGTIVSYSWTQVSGPAAANITNGTTATATAGSLVVGQYVFQLTVTDNNGSIGQAQVKITVAPAPNQPPVANAGNSQSIQLPVNSVSLNGSASSDPDGTIASYSWAQVSGPSTAVITNGNTATPTMGSLIAGQYVFELTVTDNNGATAKAQVKITVIAALNQSPIANAGSDETITLPTNSITLNGSGSYDPDGTIVTYSWIKTAGTAVTITNANTVSPTVNNMVAGQYTFELTVTDNQGATAKDLVTITVNPAPGQPNQPPVANAGSNQTITLPVNSTSLDGSNSFDPDGTITSYYWSQISGPSTAVITGGNTAAPVVSNLVAGQYVFELTVTDNNTASAKDRVTITVNDPVTSNPGQPPVANAGKDTTIALPANSVTLDGSGSMAPDGSITTYQWQEVSGPNSASFSSFSSSVSTAGDLVVGDYVFQLTITDNTGATSTATVRVKVIDNLKSLEQIALYPNPAHDVVHLRLISDSTGSVRVNLYDLNGRLVHAQEMSKPASYMDNTLNIGRLAAGMYTVQAIIGENKVLVAKLIKQ